MMNICIIDDEWICRFIIQKLIGRITVDVNISQFADGQEAFEFILDRQSEPCDLPALIILDINMPVANGWQFLDMLQALKAGSYNPRIYISSSSLDPDDFVRAKTYPAISGYLPKPVTQLMLEKVFQDLGEYQGKFKEQSTTRWYYQFPGSRPLKAGGITFTTF